MLLRVFLQNVPLVVPGTKKGYQKPCRKYLVIVTDNICTQLLYVLYLRVSNTYWYCMLKVADHLYLNLCVKITGMRVQVVLVLVLTTYSPSYFFVLLVLVRYTQISVLFFTSERVSLTVVVPGSIC